MIRNFLRGIVASLVLLTATSHAALELNVAPATITNDFRGSVVLNVSGLSAGQTVTVEKFIDWNGNGQVDANETLVQSFSLTDGEQSRIGGLRNLNVPADDDYATNGVIECQLAYPGVDPLFNRLAGNFVYRISDMNDTNNVITRKFKVSQKITAQGVRGTVRFPNGSAAGNSIVLLNSNYKYATGDSVNGMAVTTDPQGNFTLYTGVGKCDLMVGWRGQITTNARVLTVTSNQLLSADLRLAKGNSIIRGIVVDAASGNLLSGILVSAASTTTPKYRSSTFTRADGSFEFAAGTGKWNFAFDPSQLASIGYIVRTNYSATATASNVTEVVLELPRATALIHGSVRDATGHPVPEIHVTADPIYVGRSFPNGVYCIGAAAGHELNLAPDSSRLGRFGRFASYDAMRFVLSDGQVLQRDIFANRYTLPVAGKVTDATGQGIANIDFQLQSYNGSMRVFGKTDATGQFAIKAVPQFWRVTFAAQDLRQRGLLSPASGIYFNLDDSENSNLKIVLRKANGTLKGTVLLAPFGAPTDGPTPLQQLASSPLSEPTSGLTNVWAVASTHDSNGDRYQVTTRLSAGGDYEMKVFPGVWNISFTGAVRGCHAVDASQNVVADAPRSVPPSLLYNGFRAKLRGRLITDRGEILSGCWVSAQSTNVPPNECGGFQTKTDADGYFEVLLKEGESLIAASAERVDVTSGTTNVVISGYTNIDHFDLVLQQATNLLSVNCYIRDEENNPVPNIRVRPWPVSGDYMVTDSEGKFSVLVFPRETSFEFERTDLFQRGLVANE